MREITGGSDRKTVDGGNVREAIQALEVIYPALRGRLMQDDRLQKGIAVAVDGRIVRRGLYEPLESASEVYFLPALGAG